MTTSALPSEAVPRAPLGLLVGTGAIIFCANAGLLVLQLLAGRYLAPFIGSSIETWTSVIGVFLTGIALGNWVGGKIADRYPSTRTLGILLVLGGLSSLTMMVASMVCDSTGFYRSIPLTPRIPILATLFCLLPGTMLSMITPLVIRLAISDVRRAGRVAGISFALSTLGCLLGNYLTGFWLMADYTLNTLCISTTVFLVLLGVVQLFFPSNTVESPTTFEPASPEIAAKLQEKMPAEVFLNLRGNLKLAYAIVFICSFCGMSLELTASRVLAPILGVSLYTWTGIIGVMLAGTAVGNYLGGVLADRGPNAALKGFAMVFLGLVGIASAHSVGRSVGLIDPEVPLAHGVSLAVHAIGLAVGVGIAFLGTRIAQMPYGGFVNLLLIGGTIGGWLIYPALAQLARIGGPDGNATGPLEFLRSSASRILELEPMFVHLIGVALGGGIVLLLNGPPSRDESSTPPGMSLAFCLFLASLMIILVVISIGVIRGYAIMESQANIVENVLVGTFMFFFAPMLLLGTVSPQVIRMTITDVKSGGSTAGSIYAISTVGAIVGTFVTGYFLLGTISMYAILMLLSLILAFLCLFVGKLWRSNLMLFGFSLIIGASVVGMLILGYRTQDFQMETKYYAIAVKPSEFPDPKPPEAKTALQLVWGAGTQPIVETLKRDQWNLTLDHLLHSSVDLDDPTWFRYKHEHVQEEILRLQSQTHPAATNLLIIGGGGYTLPRCVEDQIMTREGRNVSVDVVEIDPGVTEVAHRMLGLPRDTKIQTYNMDGRQFIMERAQKGHYNLVVQDAVNDYSVPYHLLTREYNDGIANLLTPDGIYLLTFIDKLKTGKLWKAAARTMKRTFKHVYLLGSDDTWDTDSRTVCILYGSNEPISLMEIRSALVKQGKIQPEGDLWTHKIDDAELEKLLEMKPLIELTDQYSPVDNLMSEVFAENKRR